MTKNFGRWIPTLSLAAAVALTISCAPRQTRKASAPDKKGTAADKASDSGLAYTPGVDVTEASLRGSEFSAASGLEVIRFDYDSSSLKDEALEALKKNARYLKEQPNLEILVAGHCDERGTIEYNLALGQKRAKEVREYYIRLGVPGKSIATISYGEETPACSESTETCWSQNRRAETRIRAATASNGHTPEKSAQ